MRGSFSDSTRQKVEENSILKKTLIRLVAFSISLSLICSTFFYSFLKPLLFNAGKDGFFIFLTVVMGSVLIGSLGSFLIFSNIFAHIKKVVNELSYENPRWEWLEKEYMESEIRSVYLAIKKLHFTISSQSKLVWISQIAAQVAHDIRSPLTAINMASSDLTSIPENKRLLIKSACKRINDIANNLLSQSININIDNDHFIDSEISSELIYPILENIVLEKNCEYHEKRLQILFEPYEGANVCFSKVNLSIFKRILSNLINNCVEAIESEGIVNIFMNCDDQIIDIKIKDNGCGIPLKILPRITEKGFSYGKKTGSGFGLFYAKNEIEKINGSCLIHSEIGKGTTVSIKLLRANLPQWFCEKLSIQENASIVILDDDPFIHDLWVERFSSFSSIKIAHFSSTADLMKHTNRNDDLCLIDYELLADDKNGLDVIEHLNLNDRSFLVTNSFEDAGIRRRCNSLNVRIIPKPYVQFIPIVISTGEKSKSTIVFIDDDESMRMAWLFAAEEAGKKLDVYAHPAQFINQMDKYSKNTIIYIDSALGGNITGEIYAKQFYKNGFKEIHLTTGYYEHKFSDLPWIKTVIGKNPPF